MLFVCAKCKFIFNRTERPDTCPDCGCELVREADNKEQADYERFIKETEGNK